MESNKVSLNIEDYSVSQTTLEQVFLNFARTQVPPDENKPGCGRIMRRACCTLCMPEYVVESGHVTPVKRKRVKIKKRIKKKKVK